MFGFANLRLFARIIANNAGKRLGNCKFNTASSANALDQTVAMSYKDFPSETQDNRPPIMITHGLLGSKNNWNSIAKALNRSLKRRILTVDARNHGDSPFAQQNDYKSMSEDFVRLMDSLNIERAVFMGHSMGGRTAITLALNRPDRLEKLIVVDITPDGHRGSDAISIMNLLNRLTWKPDESLSQVRKNLDDELSLEIQEASTRQFLLMNLVSDGNKVKWKCNLKALVENIGNITSAVKTNPTNKFHGPTLFIGGSNSAYIKDDDMISIRKSFPNAELTFVPNAGHWVHSDNPRRFLEVVEEFCG